VTGEERQRLQQAREAVRRRDFAAAYSLYDALLADHPEDPDLLRDYGSAMYAEYADLEQAARLFERALAANPRSLETLLWVADLYALGYGRGYEAAAETYRTAIELQPDAADAHIGLGLLHRAPSRPVTLDEAIGAFRAATLIDPGRADAHLDLGAALIEAGERDRAAGELRQARQLLAANGELRQARGIDSVLQRLSDDELVRSVAFSYQSPRFGGSAGAPSSSPEAAEPPH
jgi:tetratricopeptide (TPR) repeat protein